MHAGTYTCMQPHINMHTHTHTHTHTRAHTHTCTHTRTHTCTHTHTHTQKDRYCIVTVSLWEEIEIERECHLFAGSALVTVATGPLSDAQEERAGLVKTHAYAVLNIVEAKVRVKCEGCEM